MNKMLSVVIPAFNEEDNIDQVVNKIKAVFVDLRYQYEIIIVDDGSSDGTLEKVKQLAVIDPEIFFVELSRNFGHQLALKAGLDLARGECVISLDADLQHPPSLFREMLYKWEEGYDIVYTRRQEDKGLPFLKRKSSTWFYKLMNSLSDIELESGTADFRLLDRRVVNVLRDINEQDPFIRGLVSWLGFRKYAIDYVPDKRFAGSSKYNLKKMRKLAIVGVTSFSTRPLNLAIYIGFFFSGVSLLYFPYILYSIINKIAVNGWASLIATIAFFGGLQLIILGIIGIYIGKMFMQTKERPVYVVRTTNIHTYKAATSK